MKKEAKSNKAFEAFIFKHFDTDTEFVTELNKRNESWDKSKFSRIKLGTQQPKVDDLVDMSYVTKTPIADIAMLFVGD